MGTRHIRTTATRLRGRGRRIAATAGQPREEQGLLDARGCLHKQGPEFEQGARPTSRSAADETRGRGEALRAGQREQPADAVAVGCGYGGCRAVSGRHLAMPAGYGGEFLREAAGTGGNESRLVPRCQKDTGARF